MNTDLAPIFQAILEGDNTTVETGVRAALMAGFAPETILNESMIAAMDEVGRLFEEGDYFVPEMLISARAMQTGLALLKPALKTANVSSIGRVVIGTIKGDMHDIGKNLVAMMLEGAGFEVVDLGVDVAPERFVACVQENGAEIVALSALLSTTLPNMDATIAALSAAGLRQRVKVMIGGAPVTEEYARQIGADGYSPDASRAVALARSLMAARFSV